MMPAWLPLELVHFQRPLWLWALLLVPLPWLLWRRRRGAALDGVVDPHLLPHLLEPAPATALARVAGASLALLLAVLALAGPGWRKEAQPRWQAGTPLVIALDVSLASAAPDLPPSRLAQARAKLERLLELRQDGEVGLVAWAADAYTVAPLTSDAGNIALYLDALEPGLTPVDGHRPELALAHAASLLRQAGFDQGQILLLTGQSGPRSPEVAAALAAEGYRTSVLGLGTPAGAPYRDAVGQARHVALDEPALRALARAGGGRYARLRADDADLDQLGVLQADAGPLREGGAASEAVWLDQGYWLLWPVLLLAALAFRRGAAVLGCLPLLLGLGLLAPAPASAAEGGTAWKRADQRAQEQLERGVQAYRNGDYQAAAEAFEAARARGADADYNLGNALARLGRYDEAIAAYDRALDRQPGMADALANRAVVEAARRRQPPAGGGGGSSGEQDGQAPQPGQGQDPGAQGQPRQGGARAGKEASADSRDGQAGAQHDGGEQASPQPADAQRQEQADREYRQRMQQALEAQASQAGDGEAASPSAEERASAERRQAHEAWLRRVPDDPGGLLRAKFRLEYERRQREGR